MGGGDAVDSYDLEFKLPAVSYTVRFNPNIRDAGREKYDQPFFWGAPAEVRPCEFSSNAMHFRGWDPETENDAAGFADGQTVGDPASAQGQIVDLYALRDVGLEVLSPNPAGAPLEDVAFELSRPALDAGDYVRA